MNDLAARMVENIDFCQLGGDVKIISTPLS
jgi:hypothetical protein